MLMVNCLGIAVQGTYAPKKLVFMGASARGLSKPYVIQGTLNARKYIDQILVPIAKEIRLRQSQRPNRLVTKGVS